MQKTVLVIADGIGHNESADFNAFFHAKTPAYDFLFANAPHSLLRTYGEDVGLPANQMGNSEVGHMCIGAGRVLYQHLVAINFAIRDGSLAQNQDLARVFACERIHIIGLLSDGGVHSHIDHVLYLTSCAAATKKPVFLHLITDGRDVFFRSAADFVQQACDFAANFKNVFIASISGRFFAMDRDNRFERVQQAYDAIARAEPTTDLSPVDFVKNSYENGVSDEFIKPAAFLDPKNFTGILPDDGVVFANFRSDRMRELVSAIGAPDFSHFVRSILPAQIATMTEYDENFKFPVLFPKIQIKNTLSDVISRAGLTQLHTAETEKYAHVTFFFNGGREEPCENEKRILVPSPKVKTYDLQPEMSAPAVGDVVLEAMDDDIDFILVNFANGDMVGHTGDFDAGVRAVEAVDHELSRILKKAREKNYALVITADHGNCEKMRSENGEILTNHTVGDVWCFVVADGVREIRAGNLSNLAATVLKIMGIKKPEEMAPALF